MISILLDISTSNSGFKTSVQGIFTDYIVPLAGLLIFIVVIAGAVAALIKGSKDNGNYQEAFLDMGKLVGLVVVVILVLAAVATLVANGFSGMKVA